MVRSLLLLVVLGFSYGCSSQSPPENEVSDEVKEETDTVFDDQVNAIDKAKKVEELALDRKRQMDEAIEESEEEK